MFVHPPQSHEHVRTACLLDDTQPMPAPGGQQRAPSWVRSVVVLGLVGIVYPRGYRHEPSLQIAAAIAQSFAVTQARQPSARDVSLSGTSSHPGMSPAECATHVKPPPHAVVSDGSQEPCGAVASSDFAGEEVVEEEDPHATPIPASAKPISAARM